MKTKMKLKNRKRVYVLCLILGLIFFGNLHPFYIFSALCSQVIFILSYENHLMLKNSLKKRSQVSKK